MIVSYPCLLLLDRWLFILWRTSFQSLPSQHVTLAARLAISLSKQDRKARCLHSHIVHNNKKQESWFIHKRRLEHSTLVWRPQTSWCAADQPSVITAKQAINCLVQTDKNGAKTISQLLLLLNSYWRRFEVSVWIFDIVVIRQHSSSFVLWSWDFFLILLPLYLTQFLITSIGKYASFCCRLESTTIIFQIWLWIIPKHHASWCIPVWQLVLQNCISGVFKRCPTTKFAVILCDISGPQGSLL